MRLPAALFLRRSSFWLVYVFSAKSIGFSVPSLQVFASIGSRAFVTVHDIVIAVLEAAQRLGRR
jgi:hypothetical protein